MALPWSGSSGFGELLERAAQELRLQHERDLEQAAGLLCSQHDEEKALLTHELSMLREQLSSYCDIPAEHLEHLRCQGIHSVNVELGRGVAAEINKSTSSRPLDQEGPSAPVRRIEKAALHAALNGEHDADAKGSGDCAGAPTLPLKPPSPPAGRSPASSPPAGHSPASGRRLSSSCYSESSELASDELDLHTDEPPRPLEDLRDDRSLPYRSALHHAGSWKNAHVADAHVGFTQERESVYFVRGMQEPRWSTAGWSQGSTAGGVDAPQLDSVQIDGYSLGQYQRLPGHPGHKSAPTSRRVSIADIGQDVAGEIVNCAPMGNGFHQARRLSGNDLEARMSEISGVVPTAVLGPRWSNTGMSHADNAASVLAGTRRESNMWAKRRMSVQHAPNDYLGHGFDVHRGSISHASRTSSLNNLSQVAWRGLHPSLLAQAQNAELTERQLSAESFVSNSFAPSVHWSGLESIDAQTGRPISTKGMEEEDEDDSGIKLLPIWKIRRRSVNYRDTRNLSHLNDTTQSALAEKLQKSMLRRASQIGGKDEEDEEELWQESWWILTMMNNWLISRPSSAKRLMWDCTGMLFIGYDLVWIPMQAFDPPKTVWITMMSWLTTCFWTFDIPCSFLVGYHDEGVLEMRVQRIARHYVRTWLPFDVTVVLIDWTLSLMEQLTDQQLQDGSSGGSGGDFVQLGKAIRVLRLLRLLRLLKAHGVLSEILERIQSEAILIILGVAKLLVFIILLNHIVACSWYLIGTIWDSSDDMNTWVEKNMLKDRVLLYRYFTCLHWSLTQFTPASMEVNATNEYERLFTVIVILFAMVAFSSFVSAITNAMTQLRNLDSERNEQYSKLRKYFAENRVKLSIMHRVFGFLQQSMSRERTRIHQAEVKYLHMLPWNLKAELAEEVFLPILTLHPFFFTFSDVYEDRMRKILQDSIEEITLPIGQELFGTGEDAHYMYFVLSGHLTYTKETSEARATGLLEHRPMPSQELRANSWCTEATMWVEWKHCGQLIGTRHSELIAMTVEKTQNIMVAMADYEDQVKQYARIFVRYFQKYPQDLDDCWADVPFITDMTDKAFGGNGMDNADEEPGYKAHRLSIWGGSPGWWAGASKTVDSFLARKGSRGELDVCKDDDEDDYDTDDDTEDSDGQDEIAKADTNPSSRQCSNESGSKVVSIREGRHESQIGSWESKPSVQSSNSRGTTLSPRASNSRFLNTPITGDEDPPSRDASPSNSEMIDRQLSSRSSSESNYSPPFTNSNSVSSPQPPATSTSGKSSRSLMRPSIQSWFSGRPSNQKTETHVASSRTSIVSRGSKNEHRRSVKEMGKNDSRRGTERNDSKRSFQSKRSGSKNSDPRSSGSKDSSNELEEELDNAILALKHSNSFGGMSRREEDMLIDKWLDGRCKKMQEQHSEQDEPSLQNSDRAGSSSWPVEGTRRKSVDKNNITPMRKARRRSTGKLRGALDGMAKVFGLGRQSYSAPDSRRRPSHDRRPSVDSRSSGSDQPKPSLRRNKSRSTSA